MKRKVGAITIGQSPRTDVIPEMQEIFGNNVDILEAGALDGLTKEEIEKFKPEENDYVLVSRLNDGSHVKFGKSHIIPRLQNCINNLESLGAELIIVICTGYFGDVLTSNIPLIYPQKILYSLIPSFTVNGKLGVIVPEEEQTNQMGKKWKETGLQVWAAAGSPYKGMEDVKKAAEKLKDKNADIIVLDCIGYNKNMKQEVEKITGKPVILSRTMVARVASELTDERR
jgi:protein AroM